MCTGEVNFILAKNRIITKSPESKTMPALELQAIELGVSILHDLFFELSGPSCIKPIKITELKIYSDSLVALSWVHSYSIKLDKVSKHSVFVMNRLSNINKICNSCPITFSFVTGEENPVYCITRSLSYNQLLKAKYSTGPDFLTKTKESKISRDDILTFTVPSPGVTVSKTQTLLSYTVASEVLTEHEWALNKCSSFHKLVSTYKTAKICKYSQVQGKKEVSHKI